jgi:ketosteroid isomerase-like protein
VSYLGAFSVHARPALTAEDYFSVGLIVRSTPKGTICRKGDKPLSETNKAAIRRFVDEVWNQGNLSVVDDFLAPTYTHYDPTTRDFGRGPEGEKQRVTLYRSAFPDLRLTIEDLLEDGDTVVARWSCRGTHDGPLDQILPTGKPVSITGISVVRFADGKMIEARIQWDALGMLQQIGVVPDLTRATV